MTWDFASELARYGPASPPVATGGLSVAREYCRYVSRSHDENFSIISWLLPRKLVPHFEAVYAWCRWADDLGDETSNSLELLAWWRSETQACFEGRAAHPVTVALMETIRQFSLPPEPFFDLISAFEQDQRVKEYDTFTQLLDYCRRSANPVGRIVLRLFECHDERRGALADEVCTGLQLANFWQDVARDAAIGRCYLPQEDRERFGWTGRGCDTAFRELMAFELNRTRGFFERGRALLALLPPRARYAVALFIGGGEAVLRAIERQDYDVLTRRPVLSKRAKLKVAISALPRLFTR